MRGLIERIVRFWRWLPGWGRTAVLAGALVLAFDNISIGRDLSIRTIVLSAVAVGAFSLAMFTLAIRASTDATEPSEIVDAAEAERDGRGPGSGIAVFVFVLTILACGLIWGAVEIADGAGAVGGDLSKRRLVLYGVALLLAGVCAPLLLGPLLFGAGYLLAPVTMRLRFRMVLSGAVPEPFAWRAAIDSIPDLVTGMRAAERVTDSDPPQYLLRAGQMFTRLTGMTQVTTVTGCDPEHSLTLETVTRGGDVEIARYQLDESSEAGAPVIRCEMEARLGSPFTKGIVRLVGVPHLARGGAEVEARRFGRLAGVTVSVEGFEAERVQARL